MIGLNTSSLVVEYKENENAEEIGHEGVIDNNVEKKVPPRQINWSKEYDGEVVLSKFLKEIDFLIVFTFWFDVVPVIGSFDDFACLANG